MVVVMVTGGGEWRCCLLVLVLVWVVVVPTGQTTILPTKHRRTHREGAHNTVKGFQRALTSLVKEHCAACISPLVDKSSNYLG